MKKAFLNIQLQRAIWAALLEQEKVSEAMVSFEAYKNELKEASKQKIFFNQVQQELQYSIKLFSEKLMQLAEKFFNNKDYPNALICYKYIFENTPENTSNIKNYITCLEKISQFDLALSMSIQLLDKEKTAENYKSISKLYDKNNDFKKAITSYKKFLELSNKKVLDAADYNTIGCHYFNSYVKKTQAPDDAKNALGYFVKALKQDQKSKIYLKNTIVAAMKAKNYKIEKACWKTYLECGYATTEDEFTYCASCLRNGEIKEWGKYYESRFRKNEPTIYPKLPKPMWTGDEDLSDKTLLVHYEQGYGDNFLMFGYMPRLVKLAKKVIYYVQNNAYDLLKDNEFGVQVCSFKNTDINKLEYDYHIPCMSLPIALKLDKSNISVDGGYIKPNKELVKKYKEKYFNTDKLKIGIAFAGVASNKKRDIPFEKLLKLDKLNNVQLYCLTKDINDKALKLFKNNNVINIAKEFETFADTAAAIENTDIILTSDNCILNLAGAMGKRTIGIFNYHYEFRWYDLTGEDCGWFKSVKPIVNDENDDWDASISKAIKEIKSLSN